MTKLFQLWDSETKKVIEVTAKKSGKEWMATCPKHPDHKASLAINEEKGVYYCHGCGWKGKLYDPTFRKNIPSAVKKETPPNIPEAQITGYVKDLDSEQKIYLKEVRGLTDKVIEKYKLGYHKKRKRFTIPIPENNKYVNVRLYDPLNKEFKILPISTGRSVQLYPEDQLKKEEILLCEGEWDALCAISHGIPAITSTAGVQTWRNEWSQNFRGKIINVCFDCQDVSRQAAEKRAEQLLVFASKVRIIDLRLKGKEDITDYFVTYGKNAKDLLELIKTTPQFRKLTSQQKQIKEQAKIIASKGMNLGQLLKAKFEPEQFWVDKGLIPKNSFIILAGLKGRGKTSLTLQLILKLIKGNCTFLKDFHIHESPKILYMFAENTKAELLKILSTQASGINLNLTETETERLHIQPREKINLMTAIGIGIFKELFDLYQPDLVIFDPIHRFIGLQDINKMSVVNYLYDSLQSLSNKCTWFFISHFRKPSAKDIDIPMYKIIGSSAFVNNCDTVIAIELAHQRRAGLFNTLNFEVRRDKPIKPIDIYMNPDNRTMEVASKTDIISGGVKVKDVVKLLSEQPQERARPTIITKLGHEKYKVSEKRIFELLRDAEEQGLVAKEPGTSGRWYAL